MNRLDNNSEPPEIRMPPGTTVHEACGVLRAYIEQKFPGDRVRIATFLPDAFGETVVTIAAADVPRLPPEPGFIFRMVRKESRGPGGWLVIAESTHDKDAGPAKVGQVRLGKQGRIEVLRTLEEGANVIAKFRMGGAEFVSTPEGLARDFPEVVLELGQRRYRAGWIVQVSGYSPEEGRWTLKREGERDPVAHLTLEEILAQYPREIVGAPKEGA